VLNISFEARDIGTGAATLYGSGSNKLMRLLQLRNTDFPPAPYKYHAALQHLHIMAGFDFLFKFADLIMAHVLAVFQS
jgi:hypothetical protein